MQAVVCFASFALTLGNRLHIMFSGCAKACQIHSGKSLKERGRIMKKLLALALALCLLCGVALAEETPTLEWSNIPEEVQANGALQQIAVPDMPVILYWVPANMVSVDPSTVQADPAPAAVFLTQDGAYTVSVFALNVTSLQEYLTNLQDAGSTLNNVNINGIDCVSAEAEAFEGVIVPMTDTLVLYFVCTPKDGDEDWDQVKGVIFSSIQVAQ